MAISPRNSLAHYAKGQILRVQHQYLEAIPEFGIAVAGAVSTTLPNYEAVMWSDVVAERGTEISAIMLDFLRQTDLPPARPTELAGEVAGISYRLREPRNRESRRRTSHNRLLGQALTEIWRWCCSPL